jgi:DNA-directed RNA polymerase subunit M/transcription elongation factor TFIIS
MPPRKDSLNVHALLLTYKAEVKEISIPLGAGGNIDGTALKTLLKKKDAPEIVATYKCKSQALFLFGYTAGKPGTENKHELPPPYDSVLCFGDILLLASADANDWRKPVPFRSTDYEVFYTKAFGGFEDLDNEEDEELDEAEGEAEPEAEAEAEPEAEAEAEAEEDDEEDLDEGDDEEEVNQEDGDCIDEVAVPIPAHIPVKKRAKKGAASTTIVAGGAQLYASYFHVDAKDELVEEPYDAPYTTDKLIVHRKHILSALARLFKDLLQKSEVEELERCLYNGAIRRAGQRHIGKVWAHAPFLELYTMFAKHISANLLPSAYVNNGELFAKYKAGEVTFRELSEMDAYQLFEDRWKDCFLEQQIREKRQLEGNKAMATDRFLCKRCHKRECTYYELQTRSADEPMTIFITCLNCGKHWKE